MTKKTQHLLCFLILILLVLGIFLRFVNLDGKAYWHDEVYTSLRAAGFTTSEISSEIFQNQPVTPSSLQKFQSLKPNSTAVDTIKSLAVEDPQHPPLYFLLARFWMQRFGSSVIASRTLPALISLLSFPLMYAFALELFGQEAKLTALLATAILALSPVDIIYAQTARQYSLLTACIIGSSWLFLRAYRLPTWQTWSLYSFASTAGLYTHPYFALTVVGHLSFGIGYCLLKIDRGRELLFKYFLAISGSFLLYAPWAWVLMTNRQQALDANSWSGKRIGVVHLVGSWIEKFTSSFVDPDLSGLGISNSDGLGLLSNGLKLLFLVLIGIAFYAVCRKTSRLISLFILTSIFVPFLLLALPDLFLGGRRSTITRYLLSCYPAIQLSVAYLLASQIHCRKQFWQMTLVFVFTSSLIFSTHTVFSDVSKPPSQFNHQIAKLVNSSQPARLITDMTEDTGTSFGDLLSLSYLLDDRVQILVWSESSDFFKPNQLTEILSDKTNPEVFIFRPSKELRLVLEQEKGELKRVLPGVELWRWTSGARHFSDEQSYLG